MTTYKNTTTRTLNVQTKDGKGDSIKAGEVKALSLADSPSNDGLLHVRALAEVKSSKATGPKVTTNQPRSTAD